jgi:hypothetical protein
VFGVQWQWLGSAEAPQDPSQGASRIGYLPAIARASRVLSAVVHPDVRSVADTGWMMVLQSW